MTTSVEITMAGSNGQMPVETALVYSTTVSPSVGVNGVVDPGITQAQAQSQLYVTIVCDENIFVKIAAPTSAGADPDATTTPRRMLSAGTVRSFGIAYGQKVAIAGR